MAYRGITHILPCRILLSSPSTGPLAPNLRQVTPLCVGVCSAPCFLPVVIPAGGAPADRSRLAPLPHWLDRLYNPPTYPPTSVRDHGVVDPWRWRLHDRLVLDRGENRRNRRYDRGVRGGRLLPLAVHDRGVRGGRLLSLAVLRRRRG